MLDAKRLLLAFLPALSQWPPIHQQIPSVFSSPPPIAPDLATVAVACEQEDERRRDEESRTHPRPSQGGERITEEWLRGLPTEHCLWQFRVTADELLDMVVALQIPDGIVTNGGHRFDGLEALAITLARFRTSGDQNDLSMRFRRCRSAISEIVNWVSTYVDDSWQHLLDFDKDHLLSPSHLESYANAIHAKGSPMTSIWGFIDCTIRGICRPSWWQRVVYNGHKKFHALKYQAVMLPNGLFGHLFGPWEAQRTDPVVLTESHFLDACIQHAVRPGTDESTPPEEHFLQLYRDPAYGLSHHIMSPYSGAGARTDAQTELNEVMASCRIVVENGFAIVLNNWPFLRATWKMRVYASPVGSYYRAGVLFTNALSCLHRNQVSTYFDLPPPTLFEYFHPCT